MIVWPLLFIIGSFQPQLISCGPSIYSPNLHLHLDGVQYGSTTETIESFQKGQKPLNVNYMKIDGRMIFRNESFNIVQTQTSWSEIIKRIETIKGVHIDGIVPADLLELLREIIPAAQVTELVYTTYIGTPSEHPCDIFENLTSLSSINSNIRGIDLSKCRKMNNINIVNTKAVMYGRGLCALDYLLQLFQKKTPTLSNLVVIDERSTLFDINRRMNEIQKRFPEIDYLSALIKLILEKTEIDKVAAAVNAIKPSIGRKQIEIISLEKAPDDDDNKNKISSLCGDWKAYVDEGRGGHSSVYPRVGYNLVTCKPE